MCHALGALLEEQALIQRLDELSSEVLHEVSRPLTAGADEEVSATTAPTATPTSATASATALADAAASFSPTSSSSTSQAHPSAAQLLLDDYKQLIGMQTLFWGSTHFLFFTRRLHPDICAFRIPLS